VSESGAIQTWLLNFNEMRILLADDHEAIRKGICTILTSHFDLRPEDCVEASNGHDAIEKVLAHKPDVVILDVNMPALGGFAAAKEILRLLPGTPILFFTMHTGEQFLLEARKAGVRGFVSKDRAGEVLVDAVKALLRNETYF
jgi:DNA-binding NarL/FixJ family response regulator